MIVTEPPSTGAADSVFAALRNTTLLRFLKRAQKAVGLVGEVTVLLCGDTRIRELNRAFRGQNKATDVLSFPAGENAAGVAGDLAISVETAAKQAERHGHGVEAEVCVLMLHGVLHLAGYDHEADMGEMRALETELRTQLKLPSGLIERSTLIRVRRPIVKAAIKAAKA